MKTEDNTPNWTEPDKDGNINIPDELKPLFRELRMKLSFYGINCRNELQTVLDMTYVADKFYSEKINTQQEIINSQQEEIKDLTETNNKFHSRINDDREIKDLLRSQVKGLLDGLDEIFESSNGIGVLNQIWVNNFVKELNEKYK
jgi:hypothetical protein